MVWVKQLFGVFSYQFLVTSGFTISIVFFLSSCSMGEELKRIQAVEQENARRNQSRSDNLTGEQIFVRSCNTCHPGGKAGVGPKLSELNEHFPDDRSLRQFIRSGQGMMPALPADVVNDQELGNLVSYLRELNQRLNEPK